MDATEITTCTSESGDQLIHETRDDPRVQYDQCFITINQYLSLFYKKINVTLI